MKPQEVIEQVTDMSIWENAIWVNASEKVFFVPIWRNGNTEFMHLAEEFGYTLEHNFDPVGYTGYAFVRHPNKRLAGQVWRAMQNQNYTLEACIHFLNSNDLSRDPHFRTQKSFLENYNIRYFINLDYLAPVGHAHIDSVIKKMQQPKTEVRSAIDPVAKKQIVNKLRMSNAIVRYIQDINLVVPSVGIVGVGNIGSILYDTLIQNNVVVKRYDTKKEYEGIDSVKQCDIIWICVDTPTLVNDKASDYDYTNLKKALAHFTNKTIIIGCTVSPGTCASLQTDCQLIYMPFLISQGNIMQGLTTPDCWFIGGDYDQRIETLVERISYAPQYWGTYQEAELAKALYNSWIIQKINFANWANDLAEQVGNADAKKVMQWLGKSDKLITSNAYMKPGWGDGGPCHPRDNLMMSWISRNLNYDPAWNQHTTRLAQAELMAKRAIATGLDVIILGKSYKPGVDSTEGSYSLVVADYIEKMGGTVYYEDHLTEGDYCYILAHDNWYGHSPSEKSEIITVW